MDVKWTSEQKKVIDLRDRDILVSAAAGSGKTAVLVERIVNRICVDNPPVDIDRMLVVTFTKAAAAEMRERVSRAIDSLKEQKPDDENLQRQSTLVHNALITTIDSFCLFVVQNNFAQLNLDPDFRIGDQAELKLMLKDALAQVFEDNYAREDNEEFINLIDTYSKGRNDSAVRQMVEDIYYKAGSSSWPRKWMNSLLRLYDIKSAKQLEDSEIIKEIVDYSRVLLEEAVQELTMAKDLASATPGLEKYALTLSEDIALFDGMADVTGREIYDGNVAVNPIKNKKIDSCAYCAFQAICRYDSRIPGFSERSFNGDNKEDVLDKMRTQIAAAEHKACYGDNNIKP